VAEAFLVALAAASGWLSPTEEIELEGTAKIHNWIADTAEYRGYDLDGYAGGVALMAYGDLGREVWVAVDGDWHGPFLSVDCAARDHYDGRMEKGDVIEISRRWWEKLELPLDLVEVRVRFAPPPLLIPPMRGGIVWQ
jgi:hypothetical protein